MHADRQRATDALQERRADPGPGSELDGGLDDADDRDDDGEKQEQDVPVGGEQLRPDEIERPSGHPGSQPGRVSELLQHGDLRGGTVLAVRHVVLEGIRNRRSQLTIDIGALLLGNPAQRGRHVAVGQRGHSTAPPFRACSDAVRSVMSLISWSASAEPAGLVR